MGTLMITPVMSSEDLPQRDRFDWWCEIAARDTVPTCVSSPHTGDFRASAAMVEMGPVQLSVLSFPELRSLRTPALVRRSDPERYGLTLVTGGAIWFSQSRNETRLAADDFLLYDTSQPFDSRAISATAPARMLILHLPKTALPLPAKRLHPLLAQRFSASGGMAAILASYLSSIVGVRDDALDPHDRRRLGEVCLDLASAVLASQVHAQDLLPPETRQQALLSRIEAFIRHNLPDPNLTPATVAAHHHISVAYLHKIFRSRDRTVAAEIRHQRLEQCRTDLTDPRLRMHPVHVIAARWGFRHAADFSRAFRTTHGLTPSDYRQQALDTPE
jgi:AraC-like DNA-binding protein